MSLPTLRSEHVMPPSSAIMAQRIKRLPALQETWVRSLGWEDSLEKGMAIHSSILVRRIPMDTRLLRPCDFLGKSTGVGCHFLLHRIFPTQGSNPGFPHCRQTLYCLSYQGSQTSVFLFLFFYYMVCQPRTQTSIGKIIFPYVN